MLNEDEINMYFYDVKCAKCGEITFTLPKRKGVTHLMRCHKCEGMTRLSIDENEGITAELGGQ